MRLAASRTFCTAGSKSPMSTAMMAITTSSSISVKPLLRVRMALPLFATERQLLSLTMVYVDCPIASLPCQASRTSGSDTVWEEEWDPGTVLWSTSDARRLPRCSARAMMPPGAVWAQVSKYALREVGRSAGRCFGHPPGGPAVLPGGVGRGVRPAADQPPRVLLRVPRRDPGRPVPVPADRHGPGPLPPGDAAGHAGEGELCRRHRRAVPGGPRLAIVARLRGVRCGMGGAVPRRLPADAEAEDVRGPFRPLDEVAMSPDEFRTIGHQLIDWIADYRAGIAARPVMARTAPGEVKAQLPAAPPEGPESFATVFRDLERILLPGLSHWQHPQFFGYFPANASLASALGDYLSTGLGVLGLSWQASPALTELEEVVTDWLRRMAGLSDAWSGVIQDTASTSTLIALLCARERATEYGMGRGGLQAQERPLVVYTSDQSHSSVEKRRCWPASGGPMCGSSP